MLSHRTLSKTIRQQRWKAALATDLTNRALTPRGNPLGLTVPLPVLEPVEPTFRLIGVGQQTWGRGRAKHVTAPLPKGLYPLELADHFHHSKLLLDQDDEIAYRVGGLSLGAAQPGSIAQWRAVRRECLAVADGCGLLDFSSLSRFVVEGPGASDMLQRICTNNVAGPKVPVNALKYTMLTNDDGEVTGSMTVLKMAEEKYLLMCYALTSRSDWELLSDNLPSGVSLDDATWENALLMVTGPQTDNVLRSLMSSRSWELVNALPNFTAAPVSIAGVSATLSRVSYCGGLGYELHVPQQDESAAKLYEALHGSSAADVTEFGYTAMQVMRTEAARPCFTVDIPDRARYLDCVPKFLAKLGDDQPDFQGKTAIKYGGAAEKFLVHLSAENPHYFLNCMNVSAPRIGGKHRVLLDGEDVGYVTSGFYGFRAGRAVMFGLLNKTPELGLTGKKALTQMEVGRLTVTAENGEAATAVSVVKDAEAMIGTGN